MKLTAAKCPNCGADIEVDKNSTKVKCEYCKKTILVEDSIAKYKVEISNMTNFDKLLKLGNRAFADKEYKEALDKYERAIELNPDDPIVILKIGFCKVMIVPLDNINLSKITKSFKNAYNLVDKKENKKIINSFIKQCLEVLDLIISKFDVVYGNKNKILTSRDLDKIYDKYYQIINVYVLLYGYVSDDNELLDQIYLKIESMSNRILAKKYYWLSGKRYSYKANRQLVYDVKSIKAKYFQEYKDRHPETFEVKQEEPKQKKNIDMKGSFAVIADLNIPKKILLVLSYVGVVSFAVLALLLFVIHEFFAGFIFAVEAALFVPYIKNLIVSKIFPSYPFLIYIIRIILPIVLLISIAIFIVYYDGTWENENSKITISSPNVKYEIDNKEVYNGSFERKTKDDTYYLSFDKYVFKTIKKDNKVLFCSVESIDKDDCIDYYHGVDFTKDYDFINNEEELD